MSWELGLGLTGTLLGGYGRMARGEFDQRMADYEAAVMRQKAGAAEKEGRLAVRDLAGKQETENAGYRARVGASGVLFEGTPTDVLFEKDKVDRYEQKRMLYGYKLKSYDLLTGADEAVAQGAMSAYTGRLGMFESMLSGGSRYAGYLKDRK